MTSTHDIPNDSQPHHNHDRLLAESIVAATRGIHAKLNKLIIARLPLALPPRAQDPALYISGLLHITPIYMTFEALWRDILDSPVNDVDKKETNPHDPDTGLPEATSPASDVHRLSGCNRVQSLLQHVFLPGLMRSDRLKADIAHITGWSDSLVEDQLRADSGAASCPASKSMRFEKALPKPTRTPSDLAKTKHGLQECLKLASQRLQSMHVINWLMLAAFCALTYGALFSARRGEDIALDA
ncbi:hypothetical protein NW754_011869 [Fusarium falciforme]|nr:hypothetical protein NW754_011869 [Fusarium falciforme]